MRLGHQHSTEQISSRVDRLLSPVLFPRALDKPPRPPSLRASLLPPPCAEIDERPRSRVRRFKLWRDQVPQMRVCLLDPKRRWNLRRWQDFAIPSQAATMKGLFRHEFPSTRTPSTLQPPAVKLNRAQRHAQRERLKQHTWVLDVEHERRFRAGLKPLMKEALVLRQDPTRDHEKVSISHEERLLRLVSLFRNLRQSDNDLFHTAPIRIVKGREAAKRQVQEDKDVRQKRKEERRRKREARTSAPARADADGIPLRIGPSRAKTPPQKPESVLPKSAFDLIARLHSPVLRVCSPSQEELGKVSIGRYEEWSGELLRDEDTEAPWTIRLDGSQAGPKSSDLSHSVVTSDHLLRH